MLSRWLERKCNFCCATTDKRVVALDQHRGRVRKSCVQCGAVVGVCVLANVWMCPERQPRFRDSGLLRNDARVLERLHEKADGKAEKRKGEIDLKID